jgi:predicted nuclease of restriction endonuclease-like (RecB) superfamily
MHRDQPDQSQSGDQTALFKRIRDLVLAARKTIARGVDLAQVQTCFLIGRNIVEHEQAGEERAAYGQEVLKALAERLTAEFGRGFSKANLQYMRRFFLLYQDRAPIAQTVSGQFHSLPDISLSWSHYVFLLGIETPGEREFYEIEATNQDWSLRELKRQFDSSLYERLALSRDKEGIKKLARHGQVVSQPADLLKEPMVLEFLGLREQQRFSESELESAIITRIEQFLLELGKGFLFEARQKRFTLGEDHFYVDLVFYNRLLRCYVLIDLKIGRLTHQDLGQMQMYVNTFDRQVRMEGEQPTVGIILCKRENNALVEITQGHRMIRSRMSGT